jgi:hypothetical protein
VLPSGYTVISQLPDSKEERAPETLGAMGADIATDAAMDTALLFDSQADAEHLSDMTEEPPPALDFEAPRLTIPTIPTFTFNSAKHRVGPLCKQGHDHTGLGESVREIGGDKACVECRHARSARHAAKVHQTRAKRRGTKDLINDDM